MRIRRGLPIIVGVLLVAGAVALIVELRKHAPPEPARLLPGGDAFIYVNLSWVRRVNAVSQLPPVSHDPEYERFIQETGFQFERDLDRAAFAVHYPNSSGGQPHFTEVFEGNIHAEKLAAYLHKISKSVDSHRAAEIFNIPLEGRTLRVAILGVDTVAVSNHDDPGTIRGMIDRSRKLASPFGGPAFLRQYYKRVPIASLAWAIVRVDNRDNRFPLGNGMWSLLFPKQGVAVLSARYLRALHLRGEAFLNSEDDARQVTEQVNTLLNIFHSAESNASAQGTDPDVKEFFDSLKVEQQNSRSVLTATLPQGFIRKVFTEPPPVLSVPEPQESPTPPVTPKKKKQRPRVAK
ncbi:MAG TPA: hypothetical protein VJX16_23330 [Terriglobales bacterium]|nr:hypothetical protein [Terriglobales bacterium]